MRRAELRADCGDRRRDQLQRRRIHHDQQAQLIRRSPAAGQRLHPLRRPDAERRRRVAQPQQIRAQIAAQVPEALGVFCAYRKQPPQHRPQRRTQPFSQSRTLHRLRQPRPEADRPGQRQRQLQSRPCAAQSVHAGRKRHSCQQIRYKRKQNQSKPEKIQQHISLSDKKKIFCSKFVHNWMVE